MIAGYNDRVARIGKDLQRLGIRTDRQRHRSTGAVNLLGQLHAGLGFALVVMKSKEAGDNSSYYALKATATSVELVGIEAGEEAVDLAGIVDRLVGNARLEPPQPALQRGVASLLVTHRSIPNSRTTNDASLSEQNDHQ